MTMVGADPDGLARLALELQRARTAIEVAASAVRRVDRGCEAAVPLRQAAALLAGQAADLERRVLAVRMASAFDASDPGLVAAVVADALGTHVLTPEEERRELLGLPLASDLRLAALVREAAGASGGPPASAAEIASLTAALSSAGLTADTANEVARLLGPGGSALVARLSARIAGVGSGLQVYDGIRNGDAGEILLGLAGGVVTGLEVAAAISAPVAIAASLLLFLMGFGDDRETWRREPGGPSAFDSMDDAGVPTEPGLQGAPTGGRP